MPKIIYRYTLIPPQTTLLLPENYKILKVAYSSIKDRASLWVLLDDKDLADNPVVFVPIPTGARLTENESLLNEVGQFNYVDSFETVEGLVFHVFTTANKNALS